MQPLVFLWAVDLNIEFIVKAEIKIVYNKVLNII